jgi:hypothetical protein
MRKYGPKKFDVPGNVSPVGTVVDQQAETVALPVVNGKVGLSFRVKVKAFGLDW